MRRSPPRLETSHGQSLAATLLGRSGTAWNDLRRMRIRTETAASTTSLAEYLRRCECFVETVDARTIEVRVATGSLAARHEQVELEGYLLVWHAMHPDGRVERLTPPAA